VSIDFYNSTVASHDHHCCPRNFVMELADRGRVTDIFFGGEALRIYPFVAGSTGLLLLWIAVFDDPRSYVQQVGDWVEIRDAQAAPRPDGYGDMEPLAELPMISTSELAPPAQPPRLRLERRIAHRGRPHKPAVSQTAPAPSLPPRDYGMAGGGG
jgi:hypothetical protein